MAKGQPDERTMYRILASAEAVPCRDMREAAILGGLVASLRRDGKISLKYIQHHAAAALEWVNAGLAIDTPIDGVGSYRDITRMGHVNHGLPSESEIKAVSRKFLAVYNPPPDTGVAVA